MLTCHRCNQSSGDSIDVSVRTGRDLKDIASGKRTTRVKFIAFDQTVSADLLMVENEWKVVALPAKSDPRAHQAMFEAFDRAEIEGISNWTFGIDFSLRHSPWHEAVGWLRVAYLYAFAALGYRFILRPELNLIREQFERPSDKIVPQVIKHVSRPLESDGFAFIHTPSEMRSVLVHLGPNLFFFPSFTSADTFYDRMAAQSEGIDTFEGVHFNLPRTRVFALDFAPQMLWLTVPLEERPPTFTW